MSDDSDREGEKYKWKREGENAWRTGSTAAYMHSSILIPENNLLKPTESLLYNNNELQIK